MEPITFSAVIIKEEPHGGAYIEIPFDVKAVFGKARIPVLATVDGEPYNGLLLKMGLPLHVMGIPKALQAKIGKHPGSTVHVTLSPRTPAPLPYKTVEEYFALQKANPAVLQRLHDLRALIHACHPGITEKIAYSIPTFVLNGNLEGVYTRRKNASFCAFSAPRCYASLK